MTLKFLVDEDVCNYKKTSMFIGMPYCDGKCWKDLNAKCGKNLYDWSLCHNEKLRHESNVNIDTEKLVNRYLANPLTKAVVFGGMEPLLSTEEVLEFISILRKKGCHDDVVIYTGYTIHEGEVLNFAKATQTFDNIFMKLGRYVPGEDRHMDKVLGVMLASDNQYGIDVHQITTTNIGDVIE